MPEEHIEKYDRAVIEPRRGRREAPVTTGVVMSFTDLDYRHLCGLTEPLGTPRSFAGCPFTTGTWLGQPVTLVGPALGAPYAVLVLEKLIALGGRAFVAVGWSGSLQPDLVIGDLVVPQEAVSEEGTSAHYKTDDSPPSPDPVMSRCLKESLHQAKAAFRVGTVWTTDAFYRETRKKVTRFAHQGLLAVDMEMSALFTVGKFRHVAVAGLLVISDELATLEWRYGGRQPALRAGREIACRAALNAVVAWQRHHA